MIHLNEIVRPVHVQLAVLERTLQIVTVIGLSHFGWRIANKLKIVCVGWCAPVIVFKLVGNVLKPMCEKHRNNSAPQFSSPAWQGVKTETINKMLKFGPRFLNEKKYTYCKLCRENFRKGGSGLHTHTHTHKQTVIALQKNKGPSVVTYFPTKQLTLGNLTPTDCVATSRFPVLIPVYVDKSRG